MAWLDLETERCLEAIRDIIASPNVEGFVVGFTAGTIAERRRSYRGEGFHCLVMLADHLDQKQALDLEGTLWDAATSLPKWGKTGDHRRSTGGAGEKHKDEPIHGVYVAWWKS